MDESEGLVRQRLSALTAEQRTLLIARLAAAKGASPVREPAPVSVQRAAPRRLDFDSDGGAVAVHRASTGQQRMWFMHQYAPRSPVYNTPAAFRLQGEMQALLLEEAFQHVIARHDTLRATFAVEEGELVQRIVASSRFRLEHIVLTEAVKNDRETSANRGIAEAAARPFDLFAAPPFRVALASIAADDHVLLIVMHHILSDGWSFSNLCREISSVYSQLVSKSPVALAPLPVQFPDCAAWEQQWQQTPAYKTQEDYWARRLAVEPEPLNLPSDRPRPAAMSFGGGECHLSIDTSLLKDLKALALRSQATLFMVLLASFKALLFRYTGQADLLVGVPIANRARPEFEGLIGLFMNTIVMRTELSADLTFEALLSRVKETAIGAYEHQAMPLDMLMRRVKIQRDTSRTPLFQATFALQDHPKATLHLPGMTVAPARVSANTAKFDVSLVLRPAATGLNATLEFSTDLFDADRAERMLEHWREILRDVAADPTTQISELALMTVAERHRMLVTLNQTAQAYPRGECLHRLFEAQAKQTPDRVALRDGSLSLTYGELDRQANGLAEKLIELGVRVEGLVGLCVPRSHRMLVAQLAILKAGAAYVPLDPHAPAARLALILEDAEVSLLLTERAVVALFPAFSGTRLLVDEWDVREIDNSPATDVLASNAAYVMFTSGSTGRPKGVVIEHRSVVNLMCSMKEAPGLDASDVLLAVTTMSFDISVLELFLPLIVGACVVIVSDDVRADGEALAALIDASGATVLQATPATWQMLMRAGWRSRQPLKALCGGEALSSDLARQILARCPELWNLYGPTETTIWSLRTRIRAGEAITIGRPISNTSLYVVDAQGQPRPVGIPGELWIGGDGVARGYFKRPELTTAQFIANPFSSDPEDRVYRTGDLAKWLPDGTVELLGRLDAQVKIRGFRVEPGEIEAAVLALTGVREAVAVVSASASGDPMLVAYLVASAETKPDVETLRHHLLTALPDYMVPNAFVWIDAVPLSANGKVDRKALVTREIVIAPQEAGNEGDHRPRSLMELELIRIWQRLFSRTDIGRQDNFFDLGGHSLLATRLVVEIQKVLDFKLPVATLFQSPSIELLARRLVDQSWTPPWSSLVPLQPEGAKPPIIFVHGWGGYAYPFLKLARLLGPDQPSYGIQAVEIDNRAARHSTVEAMAAHYVRELVSFQPEGAFYLAGYSVGGLIAYEVASQLRRLDREVALVAILDGGPQRATPLFFYALARIAHAPHGAARIVRRGWKMTRPQLAVSLREKWALWRPRRTSKIDLLDSTDHYFAVAHYYRPRPYPGTVDFFVCDETAYGWRRWYWKLMARGGSTTHRVPGSHESMIESDEHAPALASAVNAALEHRQRKQKPTQGL